MAIEKISGNGVLIATPVINMAVLVSSMLRTIGRRDIREANDAATAQSELNRRLFDIVILDDALDATNALDIVRRLRRDPDCHNRHTPIIMMSSAPDAARIAAARDAGVTEFLRKPFAAADLQARLDSIAASPRPFIESAGFAGPDRRRKRASINGEERRAGKAPY